MFFFDDHYLENIALIDSNGSFLSYSDLTRKIKEFSDAFNRRHLVFIVGENDVSSIVCYLSCLESDMVPLLLSPKINLDQLKKLIEVYKPRYIFQKLEDLYENYSLALRDKAYSLLVNNDNLQVQLNSKLALLLTTSGSTGSPKLVRLTKQNLISNARSISNYLKISPDDRVMTSLPFNYSFGLSVINSHLISGSSIVLSNASMIEGEFWKKINEHSVTGLSGVPYNYEMILKLGINRLKIPSINTMTQAGGRLDFEKMKAIYDGLKSKKIDFYSMYGQTEATARISYLAPNDIKRKRGSIGKAIPDGRLWLEDKNGKIIDQSNTIGELIYSGENVSMGYANSLDDLKLGDINKGILRTGDLANFDSEGYFYIKGSISRFIKVFGNRISLDSVEEIISSMGFECASTGKENMLLIFVENHPSLSIDALKTNISNLIGINQKAIEISSVSILPRLINGKIDYKALREGK
jgi:acyl-coenzyme A synthetase/AMP-(fatty) acid ligase